MCRRSVCRLKLTIRPSDGIGRDMKLHKYSPLANIYLFVFFLTCSASAAENTTIPSLGIVNNYDSREVNIVSRLIQGLYFVYNFNTNLEKFPTITDNRRNIIYVVGRNLSGNEEELSDTLLSDFNIELPRRSTSFSIRSGCMVFPFTPSAENITQYLAITEVVEDGDLRSEATCAAAIMTAIFGQTTDISVGQSFPDIVGGYLGAGE